MAKTAGAASLAAALIASRWFAADSTAPGDQTFERRYQPIRWPAPADDGAQGDHGSLTLGREDRRPGRFLRALLARRCCPGRIRRLKKPFEDLYAHHAAGGGRSSRNDLCHRPAGGEPRRLQMRARAAVPPAFCRNGETPESRRSAKTVAKRPKKKAQRPLPRTQ